MKYKLALAIFLLIILGILLFNRTDSILFKNIASTDRNESHLDLELDRLLKIQKHVEPNSPEGLRTAEALEKLKQRQANRPKAEHPDEFARILHEMKTPYGSTEPQYPMNYKIKELQKARMTHEGTRTVLPWIERGPGNVPGRARGLIVDPDDPALNTWYVGSVGGGIWKTTDAGVTWIDLTPDFPSLAVSVLAMAESNHDIIYAGTGESMFNVDVINGDGIFKSTDRGQTWTQLASTANNPQFNNIARLVVDPQNPDIVVAATTAGRYRINYSNTSNIFKTTDGGVTWNEVFNETEIGAFGRVKKVLQIVATPGNFNVLFAGVDEKGILKSTDAGDTWSLINNGITSTNGRFELAISPTNPNKIYAAKEGNPSDLFVSSDAGSSWVRTTEPGGTNWLGSQGWYDNTIVVHPTNENTVYVGGVRLYQIDVFPNNSRITTQLSTGPVHVDHHNLVIIPKAGGSFRILNANDGGIGISQDSIDNWSKPTQGMNTSQFYGVDKKPGASAYVGGMQDNGTWRSPENSMALDDWVFQIGGDGYETSWHFNDPLKIIGGSQFNGLRRSLDGGLSYSSATSGLGNTGSGSAPFITKIAKTNMEPDLLFAVGSSGVWRSTNFGGSWSLTAIPSSTWGTISSFLDVKISRANPDIVWAGSRMDPSGKIHVSTDRGLSFTPTTDYALATTGRISGLATHPTDDSTAYVLFSFAQKPKVIRTTDLGNSWEDLSGFGADTVSANGFPDVAVYDLLVLPHTPDTIWAGTEIGLFESTDNGLSWHMANNGLPAVPIWAMTHVEEEVVLATHGRGIWSVEIPGLSAGQTFGPLIKDLFQSPNGFLSIDVGLRSRYDSSAVFIGGQRFTSIGANSQPTDTLIQYPVTQPGVISVLVSAYKDGTVFNSDIKNINVVVLATAQASYQNNFNSPSNDFIGTGFQIRSQSGFSDDAIHSSHPHGNNQNLTYMLTIPIIVADSQAVLSYDDVAIMEPGEPGTVFGNMEFWDYVVVEGTRDGINWIPLADGYDARFDPVWLSAYNTNTPGNSTMYRNHQLNLLSNFSAGEHILIRFRLFADAFVTGWGWAIDNLEIQQSGLVHIGVPGKIAETYQLSQNYPNPFNPTTKINFRIAARNTVKLIVYNTLGQKIRTLVNRELEAGVYDVTWNGRNEIGTIVASGVYIYRLEAGTFKDVRTWTIGKTLIIHRQD
jgi:photosystem II stability/assembly factor-like uncharacterized protein